MSSRNFIRNSLNIFGDLFPFLYIDIFKNKKKLKEKYFKYLNKFYFNWKKYNQELILELEYPQLFQNLDCANKIMSFLNIKNKIFLENFPKFERYKKEKNFIDPSTILSKQIYNQD